MPKQLAGSNTASHVLVLPTDTASGLDVSSISQPPLSFLGHHPPLFGLHDDRSA